MNSVNIFRNWNFSVDVRMNTAKKKKEKKSLRWFDQKDVVFTCAIYFATTFLCLYSEWF